MLRIIRARRILEDAKLGDSISINGVDLTVTAIDGDCFPRPRHAGDLPALEPRPACAPGTVVNLERSLRPTDRLSGHIVRGVVEGAGDDHSFSPKATR